MLSVAQISATPISRKFCRTLFVRGSLLLLAVVMSFSLAVIIPHDYAAHFRFAGLSREVAGHTIASPMHEQPKPRLTSLQVEPIAQAQMPILAPKRYFEANASPPLSTFERLCRLKLGSHRNSDADPMA
jgi:hypothetical protein